MRKRSKVVVLMALLAVVSVLTSPPSPTWAVISSCPGSLCSSASHCADICPSATSVACVNSRCQYNFGPGGPGGSQGCPVQGFCQDDGDCDFDFVQGTCVNNLCVC